MPLILPSAALAVVLAQAVAAAPQKKEKTYPAFELNDHPSIVFGKGSHLDFRARFSADYDESEASTDDPAERSALDLGKKRLGGVG